MTAAVLDACCGSKMFWFDKHDDRAVYCDKRSVPYHEYYPGRYIEVSPDVECDFRRLPFPSETFWHVVFDPPHLKRVGEKSWTFLKYGSLDETWPQMIHDGFCECWRVLKTGGTLVFKWSSVQIPLSDVLDAIPVRPLYGNRSGTHLTTHWMAFVKFGDERDSKDCGDLFFDVEAQHDD